MSFFIIEKSTSGSIVSKVVTRSLLPFLYPMVSDCTSYSTVSRNRRGFLKISQTTERMNIWFINALVGASFCQKHANSTLKGTKTIQSPLSSVNYFRRKCLIRHSHLRTVHTLAEREERLKS